MNADFKGYTRIKLSARITDDAIVSALHQLFDIPEDQILINREDDWWLRERTGKIVICDIDELEGDFPTASEFISFQPDKLYLFTELELVGQFCELLDCHALVSDTEAQNPYGWMHVYGKSKYQRVQIDPVHLENEGKFTISHLRSTLL